MRSWRSEKVHAVHSTLTNDSDQAVSMMINETEPLSPSQGQAVLLLASGRTGRQVADTVGVTPETVSRWRKQPSFEAELNRIRQELIQVGVEKLRQAVGQAVDGLIELTGPDSPPETRRRACLDVLSLTSISLEINRGIGPTDPIEIENQPVPGALWPTYPCKK